MYTFHWNCRFNELLDKQTDQKADKMGDICLHHPADGGVLLLHHAAAKDSRQELRCVMQDANEYASRG